MKKVHIHTSVESITGINNKEDNTTYCLSNLQVRTKIQHFCSHFPQPLPWRMQPIQVSERKRMCIMMHRWLSPKESRLLRSTRKPLYGASGTASDAGFKPLPASTGSMTMYHFYKYFLTRRVEGSFQSKKNSFTNKVLRNTSTPWGKYLRLWGPYTAKSTQ